MKLSLTFVSLFLVGTNAFAFDKLYCQSSLRDWIMTLTDSTKTAVMTPFNQQTTLTEAQSQKLIIKGINAETVVTIFPWNSFYVRIPDQTKKSYDVHVTESLSGFLLEITDKKSNLNRRLNCRFTF